LYKATIVRGQAKERTHITQAMGHGPDPNRFQLIWQWIDSISTYHVAQKFNFRLEQFTLGWLGLKSHVPKTIEDDSLSLEKFLRGTSKDHNVIQVATTTNHAICSVL